MQFKTKTGALVDIPNEEVFRAVDDLGGLYIREFTRETLSLAVKRLATQSERSLETLRALGPFLRDSFCGLDTNNQEAVLAVLVAANRFGAGNVLNFVELSTPQTKRRK